MGNYSRHGGMPEWLIGAVLKTARAAKPSGVRIPLPPPKALMHKGFLPRRRGEARLCLLRFCRRTPTDAPWAHLKVLSCNSIAAYIGSANVTGAAIAGSNLALGILVRGSAVAVVERALDLFRET